VAANSIHKNPAGWARIVAGTRRRYLLTSAAAAAAGVLLLILTFVAYSTYTSEIRAFSFIPTV